MKFVCVTEGYDPSRVNAASATAAAEAYASRHDALAGEGASERTVFVRADASDEPPISARIRPPPELVTRIRFVAPHPIRVP